MKQELSDKQEFASRLNDVLDEAGFTKAGRQTALGKLLGTTQKGARKWLIGESIPSYEKLLKIALNFDVGIEWLLSGRGQKYFYADIVDKRIKEFESAANMDDSQRRLVKDIIKEVAKIERESDLKLTQRQILDLELAVFEELSDLPEDVVTPAIINKFIAVFIKSM